MSTSRTLSIITPVYNGSDFILRCYNNILLQTNKNWEWVIVDDGSTDDTPAIINNIVDDRIRLIRYEKNKGRGYARNLALKESRGEWIVVWDVDDLHFPERLEKIEQARIENFDFFCSYAVVVNNNIQIKGIRGFSDPAGCFSRGYVHPTLALKKTVAEKIGYTVTHGVGGIGEDVKISWVLPIMYNGLWFEDALSIYQEDREINLRKTIDSNIAQVKILNELVREKIIKPNMTYGITLLRYIVKLVIIHFFLLYPKLYLGIVGLRDYGLTKKDWKLSQEKIEFVNKYRT